MYIRGSSGITSNPAVPATSITFRSWTACPCSKKACSWHGNNARDPAPKRGLLEDQSQVVVAIRLLILGLSPCLRPLFVPSEAFGHPAASSGDNQALTCCTPAVGDNGPVTFPMSNESMETFVGSSEAPELDFMMQNINISDLFAPDDYSDLSPQEVSRIIVYPT